MADTASGFKATKAACKTTGAVGNFIYDVLKNTANGEIDNSWYRITGELWRNLKNVLG